MRFDVITVMPDMFKAITENGVSSRAVEKDLIQVQCWNPRKHTTDRHQTVDDRPYGGGPGMVMKPEPLAATINEIKAEQGGTGKVIYLSPQGKCFEQSDAIALAKEEHLTFVAGRYEGVDERFIERYVDEEYSIGDYVLSGGDLAAMVMIDAISRMVPEVLGHQESAEQDSFMDGLLDCPHYTRPESFEGMEVPSVLLSGNHAHIARWRRMQSLGRTQLRRPDLLKRREQCNPLSDEDYLLLAECNKDK